MMTVVKICVWRLWNNPYDMALAFLVPVLFFSIFAVIFVRGIASGLSSVRLAIVDDDQSATTSGIVHRLGQESSLQLVGRAVSTEGPESLPRLAKMLIREQGAEGVIYFPLGVETALRRGEPPQVGLLLEGTNPMARDLLEGLLRSAMALAAGGATQPTPPQTVMAGTAGPPAGPTAPGQDWPAWRIATVDLFAAEKSNPKIAMYAAGIAVMFLLFSATGAGGTLLEEFEAGTLDRLLASRLRLTELLAGKWLFIAALGVVQLTVMFAWAQLVFGVDLTGHLGGFAVMALATSAATASLAMCLATACRTRTELNAVAIVVILTMSALGGSMVPRYVMSPELRQWGRFTFNAWALEGFQKVFWYELPVTALAAELAALGGASVLLSVLARILATRWQAD